MSVKTIEDLYGVETNFRVLINFDTIVQLVDSMGGIVVDNPETFVLWEQTYKEGRIWLNGDMALLFSRARTFSDGDLNRIKNQQIVIEGIMDRLLDPRMVVNYKSILNNMSPYLRTNIPPDIITQLFSRQIALGGDWTIEKMAATGTFDQRPTYSMGSEPLSVVIPDEQSLMEIRTAIDNFMRRID
jgi:anionic cell wall polymer biosynthesis LytR-Cps2A-Psr (LCP) family protein